MYKAGAANTNATSHVIMMTYLARSGVLRDAAVIGWQMTMYLQKTELTLMHTKSKVTFISCLSTDIAVSVNTESMNEVKKT